MSEKLVIIPTYNEIENIENIIAAVMNLNSGYDVLVIDDGSPDGTADKVKELIPKYGNHLFLEEREGKLGLGTAYIYGFGWALERSYQYIFEMDADFSHDPNDLDRLYDACKKEGNDVSIGSRYVTGVNVVNWPMGRVLLSYFASKYVRIITRMPFQDTTAGFVCYSREVLETIDFNRIHFIGYAFQIEMKFKAWKYKFKIKEVPVIFTDRKEGSSKMSQSIFAEAIFGIIKLKFYSFFRSWKR